jgi:hypothetical protein
MVLHAFPRIIQYNGISLSIREILVFPNNPFGFPHSPKGIKKKPVPAIIKMKQDLAIRYHIQRRNANQSGDIIYRSRVIILYIKNGKERRYLAVFVLAWIMHRKMAGEKMIAGIVDGVKEMNWPSYGSSFMLLLPRKV